MGALILFCVPGVSRRTEECPHLVRERIYAHVAVVGVVRLARALTDNAARRT